jgi:hypothetical protein
MTALARANSNCKRQASPLVRESDPHQQTSNWLTVIKIWSQTPDGLFIPRQTGRLTVGRNIRLGLRQKKNNPCGGGVEYLHLRVVGGDEKESLKSEVVKYGREPQRTRTQERLRWQEPAAYTKNRRVLSSECAPHQKTKP